MAGGPLTHWKQKDLYMNLRSPSGTGNNGDVMTFRAIANDGVRDVDLHVQAISAYTPANIGLNGMVGKFGNVNLESGTSARFKFWLTETGRTAPVFVEDLVLKFFDLDQGGSDDMMWHIDLDEDCEDYILEYGSLIHARGACREGDTVGKTDVHFIKPIIAAPQCPDGSAPEPMVLTQVFENNLGGRGPDHAAEELRFNRALTVDGTPIDLVITVTEGDYEPSNVDANGANNNYPNFGLIDMMPGGSSNFKAAFYKQGTTEPFRVPKFNFTFFDIDQPSSLIRERVIVGGYDAHFLGPRTSLSHEQVPRGASFTSTAVSVEEPRKPSELNEAQEECAITFYFREREDFTFTFEVTEVEEQQELAEEGARRIQGARGEAFMFAGAYCQSTAPTEVTSRRLSGESKPQEPTKSEELETEQLFGIPGININFGGEKPKDAGPAMVAESPVGTISSRRSAPPEECMGKATKPRKDVSGPQAMSPEDDERSVAIRFMQVSEVSLTFSVDGGCGHNFLFAGKVCISGSCDPCGPDTGCQFDEWADWGPCTSPCGGGEKNRSRDMMRAPKGSHGGGGCDGDLAEVNSCNTRPCDQVCDPVDCKWGDWSEWSACGKCGGQKTRNRHITPAECGGLPCEPGNMEEVTKCPRACGFMPVTCEWSEWEPWSECSVDCGCGDKKRTRKLVAKSINETSDAASTSLAGKQTLIELKGYERIAEQFQQIQTSRLQALLVSFVSGALSLVLAFSVGRACSRATRDRKSGVILPSNSVQGMDVEEEREEQLYCE
jgi:hypothetical protein